MGDEPDIFSRFGKKMHRSDVESAFQNAIKFYKKQGNKLHIAVVADKEVVTEGGKSYFVRLRAGTEDVRDPAVATAHFDDFADYQDYGELDYADDGEEDGYYEDEVEDEYYDELAL